VRPQAGSLDLGLAIAADNREGKIMAEHLNVARIKDGYAAFAKGDFAVLNDLFAEDLLWHDAGRNQLSGEYRGREAVFGLFGKLMEVTEGTFRADLHAVLADDEHAVALVVITASRGGRSIEVNEAHVFHMRDGKVVEFWNASTDMYAADELIG
jgi:ketosteroid isomerase-like protein